MPVTATAAIAGVQGLIGGIQAISGSARAKKLMQQRKAYVTPDEYEKMLQATQAGMNDTRTLDYGTAQMDRAFAGMLGTADRLGADPNQLSALLDQKMQGIIKINEQSHLQNMQRFSQYLGSLDMMGKNEEAEWASRENMIKDQLQAAAADKQAGMQNIGSALNAGIGAASAAQTEKLYKMGLDADKVNAQIRADAIRNASSPVINTQVSMTQNPSVNSQYFPSLRLGNKTGAEGTAPIISPDFGKKLDAMIDFMSRERGY